MSRQRKYQMSRAVLGTGLTLGLVSFIAIVVTAVNKHDHAATLVAAAGVLVAIVLIVAGSRMDPREDWEKAAGGSINDNMSSHGNWGVGNAGSNPAEREANLNTFRLPDRRPHDD